MNAQRHAFTLVELLVVITIISILAGLSLPALSRAVGQARAMACQGNLRQLNLAHGQYAEDNRGYGAPSVGYGWHWYQAVGGYLGLTKHPPGGIFTKYHPTLDCPALPKDADAWSCGYKLNQEVTWPAGASQSYGPIKLDRVRNSTTLSIFLCSNGNGYIYNRYHFRLARFGQYHPDSMTGVAYLDGHTKLKYLEPDPDLSAPWTGDWNTELVIPRW